MTPIWLLKEIYTKLTHFQFYPKILYQIKISSQCLHDHDVVVNYKAKSMKGQSSSSKISWVKLKTWIIKKPRQFWDDYMFKNNKINSLIEPIFYKK